MTDSLIKPIDFEGPGVRVMLSRYYSHVQMEVVIERDMFSDADGIFVEILYQTRNAQGLPLGGPGELFRKSIPLREFQPETASTNIILPGRITPEIASQCYYRITPVTMSTTLSHST